MRAAPLRSLKITLAFVSKAYNRSAAAARDLFFSADLPAADLERSAFLTALSVRFLVLLGSAASLITMTVVRMLVWMTSMTCRIPV